MTPKRSNEVGLEDFIILGNDKDIEPAIDSEAFNALKENKHVNIYNNDYTKVAAPAIPNDEMEQVPQLQPEAEVRALPYF